MFVLRNVAVSPCLWCCLMQFSVKRQILTGFGTDLLVFQNPKWRFSKFSTISSLPVLIGPLAICSCFSLESGFVSCITDVVSEFSLKSSGSKQYGARLVEVSNFGLLLWSWDLFLANNWVYIVESECCIEHTDCFEGGDRKVLKNKLQNVDPSVRIRSGKSMWTVWRFSSERFFFDVCWK